MVPTSTRRSGPTGASLIVVACLLASACSSGSNDDVVTESLSSTTTTTPTFVDTTDAAQDLPDGCPTLASIENPSTVVAASSVTVNVGTATMPTGAGPVTVRITAGRAELAPINAALVSGHFKVGMRVPAAPGRPAATNRRRDGPGALVLVTASQLFR